MKRLSFVNQIRIGMIFILLAFFPNLSAQVTIRLNIDLLQGINDSSITVSTEPPLSPAEIESMFDGDYATFVTVPNADSLRVLLQSDSLLRFSETKVFFGNPGNWSLETANSIYDLIHHTGSYQLLVNARPCQFLAPDSVSFAELHARLVRLTVRNPQYPQITVMEWALKQDIRLTSLYITPYPPRLLPNTTLKLRVKLVTQDNRLYPYFLPEPLIWQSANPSVAVTDSSGQLYGISTGNTEITVQPAGLPLTGSAPVYVETDFQSQNASPKTSRVVLILQDPITDNGQKLHQRFGWIDPLALVSQIVAEFDSISEGVTHFDIVDTLDTNFLFTRYYGNFLTVDSLVAYYSTPGWPKLVTAHQNGQLWFDYHEMLDVFQLCARRNNGEIDEVWVYGHPYCGMYESILAGQNAFWWNAPPLTGTGCVKLLSIMGLNYERGVAEALHSFGHRAESAMRHVYGRWNIHSTDPNNWELFTRYDKEIPGGAHVGNIHYPPNGVQDYDYANPNFVITYADNWKRYPYILNETRSVNCTEWGCSHLDYMRWWFRHLPRYKGATDHILNNWWYYMLDYEAAVDSGNAQGGYVNLPSGEKPPVAEQFLLEQNYPNPFNPETHLRFRISGFPKGAGGLVELKIFDLLGREVKTLLNRQLPAGCYTVRWDGTNRTGQPVASGIYFYRLVIGDHILVRKMVLIR